MPHCRAEAKYSPDDQKIYIRDSACAGAGNDIPHYRFTVFHEGSHAVLRHQYERKRSFGAQALAERKVYTIRTDEGDANKLAAAIMAPYHKANFSLQMTPAQIADRFGLSLPAAARRYNEFARIYRRANNLRRPLPSGVADFLAEQRRRGYVVTSLPADEVAAIKPAQNSYTGDPCPNPNCGQFKMVRNGTSLRCEACGAATGDE
jgi:Zn-dependent peptidase ImmA (M78 family)